MTSQLRWPVLVTALLAVALTGCAAPLPPPGPTPGFTSEAEAFAAAEKTYRAYVDALNEVDLSDPETFEAVYAWTTGEANAGARREFSRMHADGLTVDGVTTVTHVEATDSRLLRESVRIDVCLDVSRVTLVDNEGRSVVDLDRLDIQHMQVSLVHETTSPTGMLIGQIDGRSEGRRCDD